MNTLFSKFDISSWCIGDTEEPFDRVFFKDYTGVGEVIEEEKVFAYNYLKGALNIE